MSNCVSEPIQDSLDLTANDPVVNATDSAASSTPTSSATPPDASGSAPAATPAQTQPFSLREHLGGHGFDVSQLGDDKAGADYLVNQLRSLSSGYRAAQEQLQQLPYLQAQLAQLQLQAQQKPAEQPKSWWKAPEYDPRWQSQVIKNEQGDLVPVPGAPADVAAKVKAWIDHKVNTLDQLARDPLEAIKPGLDPYIEQKVEQLVQARLAAQREDAFISNTLAQHQEWLLDRNPTTKEVIHDPFTGKPRLSAAGQIYLSHIQAAKQHGIVSPVAQNEYALAKVQAAIYQAQASQGTAAPTGEAAKAAYAGGTLQKPSYGGSTLAPSNPNIAQPVQNGLASLRDILTERLTAGGVPETLPT